MLHTPSAFEPLLRKQDSDNPLTLLFHQGRLLVREEPLALEAPPGLALPDERLHPVGLLDGRYIQTAWTDSDTLPAAGYAWRSLRSLFGSVDEGLLGIAGRAAQVAEWARTHRFCGACAHPMTLADGERCYKCEHCGHLAYPRISPAMIVLIRKGDAVLLALHTQSPYKRYAPLAGFLEAGESAEDAVHREVMEEVGMRVHNVRYVGSQSWPFPHSLMLAFTADWLEGEIRIDPNELAEARWFGPDDEWPEPVTQASISSHLIDSHRHSRAGGNH
ncbi:MAG: NAD(+) diphosphatase [Telluria sp.]